MRTLLTLLTCVVFMSAKAQQNGPRVIEGQLVMDKYYKRFPMPKYSIDSANIANDTLHLYINYLGGCKTPVFKLVSNGGTTRTAPPMMLLYLEQVDIGEHCKKICATRLDVGLRELMSSNLMLMNLNIDNKDYVLYHRPGN